MAERLEGTVTKIDGGVSLVDVQGAGIYRCDLRGRLSGKLSVRLAVGDEVELRPREEGDGTELWGVIEKVAPRRSVLRRPRSYKRDQVLCANIDQAILVVSVLDPEYKRAFIDRLLVGIEREGLSPLIVFNKVDLGDESYLTVVREDAKVYERLGYRTLLASAESGVGLPELASLLRDRISVVTGPSGVGKSTLLNALEPGLSLRTCEVSESSGRGKHTTTSAELVRLRQGGYVADTPGLRAFALWDVGPRELAACFPELVKLGAACRFKDCSHRVEPDCAVVAIVHEDEDAKEPRIDAERYDSYVKLRDELDAEDAARNAARKR